ncbi:MAG: TatD family hydrolase [Planctomycetota bacterium]
MIDTHCHLTFPDFRERIDGVMRDADDAGVRGAITISTSTADAPEALAIARAHDRVWCSAGVHPLYSHTRADGGDESQGPLHDWGAQRACGEDPRCVAWGEMGLDLHYEGPHRAVQHAVLEEQLAHLERWREEDPARLDKPVVLHCREAFSELIPVLRASVLAPERFVFHCFTGGPDDMRALLDFGAHVSFTGVVTYKNAPEVRDAAVLAPLDRVMVETDAPFLTPEPKRKERPCEPRHAILTARFLAELRGEDREGFESAIDENTRRFFGIEW